jgi:hypothetical protein
MLVSCDRYNLVFVRSFIEFEGAASFGDDYVENRGANVLRALPIASPTAMPFGTSQSCSMPSITPVFTRESLPSKCKSDPSLCKIHLRED